MAHKTRKKIEQQKNRGETWVGLSPKKEETKKGRIRKFEKKHKKDLTDW